MTGPDRVDREGGETDLVRDLLGYAAKRMMELEVEARTGAPAGQRSPERLSQRNGYRERACETRAGRIELAIPKLSMAEHTAATNPDPG